MGTDQVIAPGNHPNAEIQGQFGVLEVVEVDTSRWEAKFRSRTSDGTLAGPEFTTRLSMVRPLSDEDTDAFWKMLIDDLMKRLKSAGNVPDFVKGYEVTTDSDSTGEPALYLKILVSPKGNYSDENVKRWIDFTDLVQRNLMGLRLQRYPYVNVGEIRRRK